MGTEPERDCIIVGGGLAGVACAHDLAREGKRVHLLEAGPRYGGRARSAMIEGRPVDRGFQSLFRGYPETRRLCADVGITRADLRPFARGLVVNDGERTRIIPPTPTGFRRLPGVGAKDAARLGWVLRNAAASSPERLLSSHYGQETTAEFLAANGISEALVEGILRPFFGVVFLDRALSADPGYFMFLVSMMMRGGVVIPREGVGMIAAHTAESARGYGATLETGARVTAITPAGDGTIGVTVADGRELTARRVVLAADAPHARRLLEPLDDGSAGRLPEDAASVVTAAFMLDRSLYRGRTLILNGSDDAAPRIDLVCQTTNVTNPGEGAPHVLLATSVTTGVDRPVTGEDVVAATARFVDRLSPGFPWATSARLIDTVEHRFAQFRPRGDVRDTLPGPVTAVPGLLLAGDMTLHPSIEGAVVSGRRAAQKVLTDSAAA